jgi:7-carboxy-7-deazaguanine synthase
MDAKPVTAIKDRPQDKKLPVMEIFGPTIQGEGHVCGLRTVFVRFGGCDYRCSHCDSMHAVDPEQIKAGAEWLNQEEIGDRLVAICRSSHCSSVTISGGNPAIHDLYQLVKQLHERNIKVTVETQGTIWATWFNTVDYLTVSPKGPGMGIETNFEQLDTFMSHIHSHAYLGETVIGGTTFDYPKTCLKIVVFHALDLEFASEVIQRYPGFDNSDQFYLSIGNENEKSPDMDFPQFASLISTAVDNIIEDMKGFPALANARLLPQVHTLIWGQKKGV